MVSKKIVALFAVAAKAQDDSAPTAAEGGRIFSDSLNGVDVSDFLDNLTFGDQPEYIYEDVGPSDYNADNAFLSYDGTDGADDSAGRPNADNDSGVKEFNVDQVGNNAIANRNSGYTKCRTCAGLDAAACATNAVYETCNDAQDACMVQVRGSMNSAGTVSVKFWSGCASKQSCQEVAGDNFFVAAGLERYNACKGSNTQRRWYGTSTCTFCTKLGNTSVAKSILFGNDATGAVIDTSLSTTMTVANIIAQPMSTTPGSVSINQDI